MIASWLEDFSAGIDTALQPVAWMSDAACAGLEPAEADRLFFPEHGPSPREAYEMCAGCPVADKCLQRAEALDASPFDVRVVGLWGGQHFSRHVARAA